jgi:EAL domain-containing protein (putative c-di-GMP-specific phosphodiesterase class I)/DNA-binding NarL/FixJ family response regulator
MVASGAARRPAPSRVPGSVVIVADGDAALRRAFGDALVGAGLDIVEAADGRSALELASSAQVDLIILDLDMPSRSSLEVIAELRRRPETTKLPIIVVTSTSDDRGVVEALGAGADDFLIKPVRLDELVARVRARLRSDEAWTRTVESDLRSRATVVAALGRMSIAEDPTVLAEAVVREIGKWSDLHLVALLEVVDGQHLGPLANFSRAVAGEHPAVDVTSAEATRLLTRTLGGPWSERLATSGSAEGDPFAVHGVAAVAVAPIHSLDRLIWILVLGTASAGSFPARTDVARLLGSAIDYASVLSVAVRGSFASRRGADMTRTRLRGILARGEFRPVFQPIVELPSREIVGYEALTRFEDGVPPAERFAQATEVGIGLEYEISAVKAALAASVGLPFGRFLSLNVSPNLVMEATLLDDAIYGAGRPLVLELTEHAAIEDYSALRSAMMDIHEVEYAVDDAGAGYASFRHILELSPRYAKLDRTIIRAIERDPMRQALVAGLEYYALRTRCSLIAEGVETEGEAEELVALGVQLAQGHLFGEPAPVSQYEASQAG